MSDITRNAADLPVVIIGATTAGIPTTPVGSDTSGNLLVKDFADGIQGSASPAVTMQVGGSDGTNLRTISTDTSGKVKMDLFDGSGNPSTIKAASTASVATDTSLVTALSPNSPLPAGTNYLGQEGISSPIAKLGNLYAMVANGALNVQGPSGTLFYDAFDLAGLDTTNRWVLTTANGGSDSQTLGINTLSVTTAASSEVLLLSQPLFTPSFSDIVFGVQLTTGATPPTGAHSFWGLGTVPTSFTATTPLQNAIGFEIDTSGNLNAVIYSNGTKIESTTLNSFLSATPQIFVVYINGESATFYIQSQGFELPVAGFVGFSLDGFILPSHFHIINGTSAVTTARTLPISATSIGDTNNTHNTLISDGLFPWRQSTVKVPGAGALTTDNEIIVRSVPVDGTKTTYAASIVGLVAPTTATDIFTITGSASKTIRITHIEIVATQTTISYQNILLIKRSSANSGGTSTAPVPVSYDSINPAATATIAAYTANPSSLGTTVGSPIRAAKVFISTTTGGNTAIEDILSWDFGNRPSQAIVLRGTSQVLTINLNSTTIAGNNFNISIEWTEE
jgi:hypothetical protein